jgi:GNAT superfamily N-acetyltransferase
LEPKSFVPGHFRRIWPGDAVSYQAHLLRLDREGRNMRFAGAVSDEIIRDYSRHIADPSRVLHGFLQGAELRGTAELVPLADAESVAEAAFSVEQGCRRQGVGLELMRRTIRAARTRGFRKLVVRCLPTNRAMQNLARRFTDDLIFEGSDVLALIQSPPATGATFADATVDGLRGLLLSWSE